MLRFDPDAPERMPQEAWRYNGAVRAVAKGMRSAYVLTPDHEVAAVDLADGQENWRRPLPKEARVVSDPAGPIFYVYKPSGTVMALREIEALVTDSSPTE
jgi:outer membrane protein assembly factor BamB